MAETQVAERMMTSREVADLFRVTQNSVTRWTKQGKLTSIPTPGGHHRYRAAEIKALLDRPGG